MHGLQGEARRSFDQRQEKALPPRLVAKGCGIPSGKFLKRLLAVGVAPLDAGSAEGSGAGLGRGSGPKGRDGSGAHGTAEEGGGGHGIGGCRDGVEWSGVV